MMVKPETPRASQMLAMLMPRMSALTNELELEAAEAEPADCLAPSREFSRHRAGARITPALPPASPSTGIRGTSPRMPRSSLR